MKTEDIELLGTAAPATPTFSQPRGASLESYLDHASQHGRSTHGIFEPSFNPAQEIERVLSRFAGGRPVETPASADGRPYVPFTIRRLLNGKQIGLHHDYHYPLPLYSDLAPRLDTTTLVSYVVTLRKPEAGGELFVYGVTPSTPDAPKLANGYSWDQPALEARFNFAKFVPEVGDLFLLASGRCLHRVGRIEGPRARVTMGGFLALDKERHTVYYWS